MDVTQPWADPKHTVAEDVAATIRDLQVSPADLRAMADRIESQHCTGVSARWCPVHGTCTCRRGERADLNDARCPLHSPTSSHAEAEAQQMLAEGEWLA